MKRRCRREEGRGGSADGCCYCLRSLSTTPPHSRFDNKKTGAAVRREGRRAGGWCHWLLMHPKQGDETHGIPNATLPSLRKGTYLS